MAKRVADKELTHDNWDQEQEDEEVGVFRSASKEVLETREMKKAKRRGVTGDKSGAGAFKGFSFGVTATTSGSSGSKPISFTVQPNSDSAPKSVFGGGYTVASVAVEVTKSGSPKLSSGDVGTESQYRRSLRTLNESVLRWIDDHIKTNPYCILTPVFKDYEKYIKELDRDFPQSSDRVVASNSEASMSSDVGPEPFSSGTAAGNSEGKPLAPPTSTTAGMTGFSSSSLKFGAPDSKPLTVFGCGTAPFSGTTSSGFSFGSQPSKETTSLTSGFSFGAQPSKEPATFPASTAANSPTSGFSFGAQPAKDPATVQVSKTANPLLSGFSFGAQPKDPATFPASTAASPPKSEFGFGAQPSKDPATVQASKEANSGFSFGAQPAKDPATVQASKEANSGFSFGAQPAKDPATVQASKEANSGFSFGAQPAKDPATVQASKEANSGFTFGAQPAKDPAAVQASTAANPLLSGFSFGAQSSKETGSLFRFNIQQPGKEATSSSVTPNASTSAPQEGGEDDNYVPPAPEVVDIQEEGAFYTVRCKLYFKINNEYKDRGIGNLYLKPCGEKTQLLVRTATTLGNILLNIMLNKNIPASRQGNNVTLVCVPYPPLDDKKPNDKTPVCMLIRVKTEGEAETLLKQINDHKV